MLLFRHPLKSPILILKKNPITLLIISILLITAALTNPNTESHKKFMIIKLTKLTQQALPKSDDKMENTGSISGMLLAEKFIKKMVDQIISVDNYVLFSVTIANYRGQTKTIGLGFFGHVYVTSQVDKFLSKEFYK